MRREVPAWLVVSCWVVAACEGGIAPSTDIVGNAGDSPGVTDPGTPSPTEDGGVVSPRADAAPGMSQMDDDLEAGAGAACGDGVRVDPELCDDGNTQAGDGCDVRCQLEEGWGCPVDGGACSPRCGDGLVLGTEQCDDGNVEAGDGCDQACNIEHGWACVEAATPCTAAGCGDGVMVADEGCDDGDQVPGDGCSATCQLEAGWVCPIMGADCVAAECGDGFRAGDEVCDDSDNQGGDGCSAACDVVEPNYGCPPLGGMCFKTTECGDGVLTSDEACDDANSRDGDGCSATCEREPGWVCDGVPARCTPAGCGDGLAVGNEQCDDGGRCAGGAQDGSECTDDGACPGGACTARSGDGCGTNCNLESGFFCPTPGDACEVAVCGDGVVQGLEQCDDGTVDDRGTPDPGDDQVIPDNNLGDGCTPQCEREPSCSGGVCVAACGDGIVGDGEQCDDGNTANNDGCSDACEFEPGYQCDLVTVGPGDTVVLPLVLRDFRGRDYRMGKSCQGGANANALCSGNGDCDSNNCSAACGAGEARCCDADEPGCRPGHPDFQTGGGGTGMVEATLDGDGKPVSKPGASSLQSGDSFAQWYRDTDMSTTVVSEMSFELIDANAGTYRFDEGHFYPLTGDGYNGLPATDPMFEALRGSCGAGNQNFHFTSEIRYWFTYEGDEVLDFRGDDDVWVYIDSQLAVDIGGVHGAIHRCISLRGDNSGCASDRVATTAADLGLVVGGVYEVVVFQAERHTCQSSYQLTLSGFFTSKSECESVCGDGVVTVDEVCDSGSVCQGGSEDGQDCGASPAAEQACGAGGGTCVSLNDGSYGRCQPGCGARGPHCGDGAQDDAAGEQCDDGYEGNLGAYGGCAPDCTIGPRCGDGNVDGLFGEQCDDSGANNVGAYGGCNPDCSFAQRCGDGVLQTGQGEQCDDGSNISAYGGCAPGCVLAPSCGDGSVDPAFGEQCDAGAELNDGRYGGCRADCTLGPRCGDGEKQAEEACDDGNVNDFDGCSALCEVESVLI